MSLVAVCKRITLLATCGIVTACGSASSNSDKQASFAAASGPNTKPIISGTPLLDAAAGVEYEFLPQASDPDGDTLTFHIANRPEWATFSPVTGRLSGIPLTSSEPVYIGIEISVTDGEATSELPPFDLSISGTEAPAPANSPPTITGEPATSVVTGNAYEFLPQVSDPDAQPLAFSITNAPAWTQFDEVTGRLWGTPTSDDIGTFSDIVISVSDGEAEAALDPFDIDVTGGTVAGPSNRPPSISGTPAQAVAVGQAYVFVPSASDPDGQALTFSIVNKPAWANFSTSTGRLRGTPSAADVGVYDSLRISVSDGMAKTDLPDFSITVIAQNNPPQISGTPGSIVEADQFYSFLPTATDPDGDTLSFSVTNKPAWANFNTSTGRLTGTPSPSDTGVYSNIVIAVTDGAQSASLAPFAVQVQAPNRAPTIGGTPAAVVTESATYNFLPSAADPDGDTLSFSVTNKPSWATFNGATGRLSGTPSASDVGTYSNIRISVSDGSLSANLPAFSISVEAGNRAPTISGSPATSVATNEAYTFTPNASDPDGDSISFSISGKPSWATFNGSTGRLSGTPSASDVGTYSNIRISVSDGSLSANLPAFSITVQDVQTGSATLSWTPPTQNEDGSPLNDLKGYKIQYGKSASNLDSVLDIPNPGISSAVVENLSPATWYFAVKAYNDANVESALSNIASKTIN